MLFRSELEDEIYNQKWDYIKYIQSLIVAFSEDKTDELVNKWANVDRAWMKMTTPIQIGHPLEYYEDHFRKAVALEWDIRLTNPKFAQNDHRVNKIKSAFTKIFSSFEPNAKSEEYKKIFDFSFKSLDKVQLYVGRPALFFGAELNGLFSAQVVPNDEVVSLEEGKKIFAFSDEILQSSRAKPFLKLSREILNRIKAKTNESDRVDRARPTVVNLKEQAVRKSVRDLLGIDNTKPLDEQFESLS